MVSQESKRATLDAVIAVTVTAKLIAILIVVLLPLKLVCCFIEFVASQLDGKASPALGLLITQALATSIGPAGVNLHAVHKCRQLLVQVGTTMMGEWCAKNILDTWGWLMIFCVDRMDF